MLRKVFPYAVIAILAVLLLRECGRDPEGEVVVREVTVTVPEIKKRFDTITIERHSSRILKEIDSNHVWAYLAAKDSLEALKLYLEAITEREYNEIFMDSVQAVGVYSRVRGKLLRQSVEYEIYEREVATTDTVDLPPRRPTLYFSGELSTGRSLKAGLQLQTRRQAYSLSVDSDKNIWAGVLFPLF